MLLDLNMPGTGGAEVVKNLAPRHPRIVFMTSARMEGVGITLRNGPHYYLPKNATRGELSLLLQSLEA